MNRIALIALALIVAALALLLVYRAPAGPATGLEQADRLIGQAVAGTAAAEEARTLLKTIIDDRISDPAAVLQARLRLVALERQIGRHQEAATALGEALGSHPDTPQAPRLLLELGAMHHRRLKRPAEALQTYRRLVALYPESAEAPEALVRSALLARQLEQDTASADAAALLDFSRRRPDHPLADEALLLAADLAAGAVTDQGEAAVLDELHRRYPDSPLCRPTTDTTHQEIDDDGHTAND